MVFKLQQKECLITNVSNASETKKGSSNMPEGVMDSNSLSHQEINNEHLLTQQSMNTTLNPSSSMNETLKLLKNEIKANIQKVVQEINPYTLGKVYVKIPVSDSDLTTNCNSLDYYS